MKVKKEKIKEIKSILEDVKFVPCIESHTIFFPIDQTEEKEIDGLSLTASDDKANKKAVPGLILSDLEGNSQVQLAYANTTYSTTFNFIQYCELVSNKLSRKEKEKLSELECYLVGADYLFISFEI